MLLGRLVAEKGGARVDGIHLLDFLSCHFGASSPHDETHAFGAVNKESGIGKCVVSFVEFKRGERFTTQGEVGPWTSTF